MTPGGINRPTTVPKQNEAVRIPNFLQVTHGILVFLKYLEQDIYVITSVMLYTMNKIIKCEKFQDKILHINL